MKRHDAVTADEYEVLAIDFAKCAELYRESDSELEFVGCSRREAIRRVQNTAAAFAAKSSTMREAHV